MGLTASRFYAVVTKALAAEEANGNVETLMPPERRRTPVGEWELRAHLERDTNPLPPRDIFTYAARCRGSGLPPAGGPAPQRPGPARVYAVSAYCRKMGRPYAVQSTGTGIADFKVGAFGRAGVLIGSIQRPRFARLRYQQPLRPQPT